MRSAAICLVLLTGCHVVEGSNCSSIPSFDERMRLGSQSLSDPNPSTRVFAASANADACVTISARMFAPGPDTAKDVADAVTAACEEAIMRVAVAQSRADQANNNQSPLYDQVTGDTVNYNQWAFRKYRRAAEMRVAEARAGHCKPPR